MSSNPVVPIKEKCMCFVLYNGKFYCVRYVRAEIGLYIFLKLIRKVQCVYDSKPMQLKRIQTNERQSVCTCIHWSNNVDVDASKS